MVELGKFSLKINDLPNGLEKYMSFTFNNVLRFNFKFPNSSKILEVFESRI